MILRVAIFSIAAVVAGCAPNGFPDPYEGFEHTAREQGYWREITTDESQIRELHLHSAGFSVTFLPFETYKDYWGTYVLTEDENRIQVTVDGGNNAPGFKEAAGGFSSRAANKVRISGIALDPRRPAKRDFRFERFDPKAPVPTGESTPVW